MLIQTVRVHGLLDGAKYCRKVNSLSNVTDDRQTTDGSMPYGERNVVTFAYKCGDI